MGLSKRVKDAIEFMVFGGLNGVPLKRADAAQAAGIVDHTLRQAFRNPLVMAHYNEQFEILRTSARPRAFAQIVDLSEHGNAEATRFRAAAYVDGGGRADQAGVTVNVGVQVQPGYVLALDDGQIEAAHARQQLSRLVPIDAKPLTDKA